MIQDEKVRFSEGCDHGGFRPLTSIVGGLSSFLAVSQPSAADLGWPTPAGESTDERGVMRFYAEVSMSSLVTLNYSSQAPEHRYRNYLH